MAVLIAALAAGCSVPSVGLPPPTNPRTVGNSAVLEGVTIDRFEGDRLRYRATAARVRLDRTTAVAFADDVAIDVVETRPAPPVKARRPLAGPPRLAPDTKTRIEAKHAVTKIHEQLVTFEGRVTAFDRDGRVMSTERATYDVAHDLLEAPERVVLSGDNFRSEGASMRGKPIEGSLEIGAPVTTRVVPRHGR